MADVPEGFVPDTPVGFQPDTDKGSIPLDPLSNTTISGPGLPSITLNPYDVAKQEGILSGRDAPHPEEVIPSMMALTQPFVPIPKIKAESTLGKIAAAPVNVASGLLEGIESPIGLATLPLFGTPVGRAAFAALGTVQGLNQMRKAKDAGEFTEGALLAAGSPLLARTGEKTIGGVPRETPQFPNITKLPEPEVPPPTPPTEPTPQPEVTQTPPADTGEVQPQAVTPSAPEAGKAETPVAAGAEPATPTVTQPVAETKPIPMGAATAEEFEQPGTYVSNMFAAIDRDRAEMDKPPMPKVEGRTWDQDNARALTQMNRDPDWIPKLLEEVEKRPRPLLSWENAGVVWQRAKWKAEANNAYKRIAQAFEDGREDDKLEAQLQASKFEDDLERLDRIVGRGGTGSEAGRTLQAQKMAAGDDFSLVEMRLRKRAANGGRPLTPAESAEIERLHKELAEKQRLYDEYVSKTDARLAELEAKSKLASIAKTPRTSVKPGDIELFKKNTIDKIKEKVEAKEPDAISWYVQRLARALVASGINDREKLIEAVHAVVKEAIPEISRRETMDAISGYGQFRQLSKDAISVKLRGMKGEMQQLAKLEDMAKGQPPLKTGIERRTQTDAERALIKEVNDAKFKFQVPVQDPNTQLKSALDTLKTTLRNRIVDLEDRIKKGDFATRPRRQLALDPEASRLKAEAERVKKQFQRGVAIDRLKNRTGVERGADWITRWRRGFILSGPVTLAKLTSAAVQRLAFTTAEEAVGGAIGKVIPEVAQRAPREGGFNVKAEAQAITQGLTTGMRDAWDVLRKGQSDLDVIYGKEALLPPTAVDFFGHVHSALKSPTKRAEFARSLEKRMQFEINHGVDVSDPLVQSRVIIEAYKDANRSIFLQDNRVVSAYRRGLSALEQKSKITGQTPLGGKVAATAARIALPIVKVPTNIVAETLQYAVGSVTGLTRLGIALSKGVESLKPEEADLIMRELKKGSIGGAVMMLGYLNPEVIGGYYQQGEKRKKGDVKVASVRLFGTDIPSFLLHNPLLETMQIGATIRRVADSKVKKSSAEEKGTAEGLYAAAMGLTEEVPFVREMMEVTKAFNPKEKGAFLGELGKSLAIPQLVQWAASDMDRDIHGNIIKRKPTTVMQHIETGIPGLRRDVPKSKNQ